jgi:hypothetical protein
MPLGPQGAFFFTGALPPPTAEHFTVTKGIIHLSHPFRANKTGYFPPKPAAKGTRQRRHPFRVNTYAAKPASLSTLEQS